MPSAHMPYKWKKQNKRKKRKWNEFKKMLQGMPKEERLVIGADFSGHFGEGTRGDERVLGIHSDKEIKVEEQMMMDFAKRMKMAMLILILRRNKSTG